MSFMGKSFLILGTNMGEAMAYDTLKFADPERVTVADINESAAKSLEEKLDDSRVDSLCVDVSDTKNMVRVMGDYDVIESAVPYPFNLGLTKAAIKAGKHFLDLGGNNDIMRKQYGLDGAAREAGVKIAPAWGIAPGAVSIFAVVAIEDFKRDYYVMPDYVKIFCGCLSQENLGLFGHANTFCSKGTSNEYIEDVEILNGSKLDIVSPLSGFEEQKFKDFGTLEAVRTSGSSGTFPQSFAGKVDRYECKTLRRQGFWKKIALLLRNGMFSSEPVNMYGGEIVPRDFTEKFLEEAMPSNVKDMMIVRIIVGDKGRHHSQFDMVDYYDEKTGHTAMQRTTGYSAAIAGNMLVDGSVGRNGVLYPERDFNQGMFILELMKRGICLH